MAQKSPIESTQATWNPVAGCTVLSPGCTHCYAMRLASRLEAMGQRKCVGTTRMSGRRPKWTGRVNLDYRSLDVPKNSKIGRMIFVNSMSDLFHEDVPLDFIKQVFAVMRDTAHHTYQLLTKRAERLSEVAAKLIWPSNVWMGVSVENKDHLYRIDHLRSIDAKTKFLSLEPLLGDLGRLKSKGIDWAIAGGESGPGARPMDADWVRSILDQCCEQRVAFHFKQWGGTDKKKAGRILDGRTWDQFPNGVPN